jgi:hypothetical protein
MAMALATEAESSNLRFPLAMVRSGVLVAMRFLRRLLASGGSGAT